MKNQKEAVFEVIRAMKPQEVERQEQVVLSKQEKKIAEQKLFDGFRKGRIQYNGGISEVSDDKLALYVSGLVSNWLRKDKRLNGGRTYIPRAPRTLPLKPNPAAIDPALANLDPDQVRAIQELVRRTGAVIVLPGGGAVRNREEQPKQPKPQDADLTSHSE